ncbi:MAG TPA: hypothetical protein VLA04_02340 [Verrucomicrobiae bacterium]|nr:hypothetical protein [Verrucomicrobiae bacterium]
MFKFLKDFLFEENEMPILATPEQVGAVNVKTVDEEGIEGEEPAAGNGKTETADTFWPAATSKKVLDVMGPATAEDTAEKPVSTGLPLMLDLNPLDGSPASVTPDYNVLNISPELEGIADAAPVLEKPAEIINFPIAEPEKLEVAAEIPVATPVVESIVAKPATPEPVLAPKAEEKPATPEFSADSIADLRAKTEEEMREEEAAIAKFEADLAAIKAKIEARRAHLTEIKQILPEIEKTEAERRMIEENAAKLEEGKKQVVDRIHTLRSKLDGGAVVDAAPVNHFESTDHQMAA